MVRMECQVELPQCHTMIDHCGLRCQNYTRLTWSNPFRNIFIMAAVVYTMVQFYLCPFFRRHRQTNVSSSHILIWPWMASHSAKVQNCHQYLCFCVVPSTTPGALKSFGLFLIFNFKLFSLLSILESCISPECQAFLCNLLCLSDWDFLYVHRPVIANAESSFIFTFKVELKFNSHGSHSAGCSFSYRAC